MKLKRQGFRSTKPQNIQADKLQDDNVEKNITPVTHRKQTDVYCKIWDTKEKSTLTRLENSLCNKEEEIDK